MTSSSLNRPVEILLVEDNLFDVHLVKSGLKETGVPYNLHVAHDGDEAMAFLRRQGAAYQNTPQPDLILLDLNLPRRDGREILADVKADPALRRIPVIVLTTSKAEDDITKTYDLHVNCFISKPMDVSHFSAVIGSIMDFWLAVAALPKAAA